MTKTPPGFTRTLLSIAVPVTLQNLLASSFTLIDTMMIGRLGDTPLAAVGMAGKWTWFLTIVFFGFSSGASVFISQFYGAGDDAGMRRTYGLMTVGTQAASLLFMRRMGELTGLHTCVSREDEASGHEIPIPDKNNVPDGVEVFAINGPLFFGVADRFQSTLNAMETSPKVFIMYLHNMSAIDMTGIHALEEFLERRRKGCRVLFAAVRKPVHRTFQRVGILRTVGEENVFPSLDEALLRTEEILEDTIMARGKSFATADFEILKLLRERSKN